MPRIRPVLAAAGFALSLTYHSAHAGPTSQATTFLRPEKQHSMLAQRVVLVPLVPLSGLVLEPVIDEIARWVVREAMRQAFCAVLRGVEKKTVRSTILKPEGRAQIAEVIAELNKVAECPSPVPQSERK